MNPLRRVWIWRGGRDARPGGRGLFRLCPLAQRRAVFLAGGRPRRKGRKTQQITGPKGLAGMRRHCPPSIGCLDRLETVGQAAGKRLSIALNPRKRDVSFYIGRGNRDG